MKIPEIVRVASVDYDVNLKDESLILDGIQCDGAIDYYYHTIELDRSVQDVQGLQITFLHELVHAIVRENKIDLAGDFEEVTDKLAYGLHQIIRDNPEIFNT